MFFLWFLTHLSGKNGRRFGTVRFLEYPHHRLLQKQKLYFLFCLSPKKFFHPSYYTLLRCLRVLQITGPNFAYLLKCFHFNRRPNFYLLLFSKRIYFSYSFIYYDRKSYCFKEKGSVWFQRGSKSQQIVRQYL